MAAFDLKPEEANLLLALLDERIEKVADPKMQKELGILQSRLRGFSGRGRVVERLLQQED
jgi:hypothetical protein